MKTSQKQLDRQCAPEGFAAAGRSATGGLVKSFCIDFNWDHLHQAASPGLYAEADPVAQVEWMMDLGVTCVQTFCISLNGYAWYPSDIRPRQPGGGASFLPRLCEAAGRRGLDVMGYFCLGCNPVWEKQNPAHAHNEVAASGPVWRCALTDPYLDYFCESVRESLRRTDIQGFMIDWFRPPVRNAWLESEKALYNEIMDEKFPEMGLPVIPTALALEYERRLLDRAWAKIRAAANDVRPCLIWTNHPFIPGEEKLWNGLQMLREADWILNEGTDTGLLAWLRNQVGPHTKIIQNVCGWAEHDAASALAQLPGDLDGIYGFAGADPVDGQFATTGTPAAEHNARNLTAMRKFFRIS